MSSSLHTPLMVHEEVEGDSLTPVGVARSLPLSRFPAVAGGSRLGFNRENVDPHSGLFTLPRRPANSPLTPGAAAALARAEAMSEPAAGAPSRTPVRGAPRR